MSNSKISSLAHVDSNAQIGADVVIEPFVCIGPNVILGDRVVVKSHAYISGQTSIGADTKIWPGAVIGTTCQDLKYQGGLVHIKIGERCNIREYCTIHSPAKEGSETTIGDNVYMMAYCHIGHDCSIGNNVILNNNATLAGYVIVEDNAIISSYTPIHQFSRIGTYSFVGGMSRLGIDMPPYTIGGGIPFKLGGLNIVGLKRAGFAAQTRRSLSRAFRTLFRTEKPLKEAIIEVEETVEMCAEVEHLLDFCRQSKRGIMGASIQQVDAEHALLLEEERESIDEMESSTSL